MALDHALALGCGPGEAVLRLYGWSSPTVSFGRNEPARDVYDTELARALGIGFVRRPTGGRAVLHDDELTYAVVAPLRALGGLRRAYIRINEALVAALSTLGVPASLAGGARVPRPDAGPCFQVPAPGEVTLAGRKLVGSAQVRVGSCILQHGSIILRGDQARLMRLRGEGEDPGPPAALEDALPGMDRSDVTARVAASMRLALGGRWTERGYRSQEQSQASELLERYSSTEWTWRR
jgi:lipoate-protein ligase A